MEMVSLGANIHFSCANYIHKNPVHSVLTCAIEGRSTQLAVHIVKSGIGLKIPKLCRVPLSYAMMQQMDEVVTAIVNKYPFVESYDKQSKEHFLESAVKYGYPQVAVQCLSENKDFPLETTSRETYSDKTFYEGEQMHCILLLCLQHGYDDVITLLLSRGDAAIRKCTGVDVTKSSVLLLQTIITKRYAVAIKLIGGVSISSTTRQDYTIIRNENIITALTIVNRDKLVDVCMALVQSKSSIYDLVDEEGYCLLHVAAKWGHWEIYQAIYEREKSFKYNSHNSQRTTNGMTALLVAAKYGNYEMFMDLRNNGFDIRAKDNTNRTALDIACDEGHVNIAENVIGDLCPEHTVLRYSAIRGAVNTIAQITKSSKKSELNGADQSGKTALMLAAVHGNDAAGIILIDGGARRMLKDSVGRTFLTFAIEMNCSQLIAHAVKSDLPYDKDNRNPRSNEGFWFTFLDANSGISPEVRLPILGKLLSDHAGIVPLLANIEDSFQRKAMDITVPVSKALINKYLYFCGRYELYLEEAPIHVSETSIVIRGVDYGLLEDCNRMFDEHSTKKSGKLSIKEFVTCAAAIGVMEHITDKNTKKQALAETFEKFDKNGDQWMDRSEFMDFIKCHMGQSRSIVMKLMRHQEQFESELDMRNCIFGADRDRTSRFVMDVLQSFSDNEFRENLKRLGEVQGRDLSGYGYAIVMPCGDRSMQSIYLYERPDLNHIRTYVEDLAKGVHFLHSHGVAHMDIKLLNALRASGDHICLVDMDAACMINDTDDMYAGVKFSSGVLPPEMFYQLKAMEEEEMVCDYWSDLPTHSAAWKKVAPVKTNTGRRGREVTAPNNQTAYEKLGVFVVRAHRTNAPGEGRKCSLLPYKLVKASTAIDAWSFGCLLFQMLSGESLVAVNRDDNLAGPEAMLRAATWTDTKISGRIRDCCYERQYDDAVDLLEKLLKVNPSERLVSFAVLLAHRFFHPEENKMVDARAIEDRIMKKVQQKVNDNTKTMVALKDHLDSRLDRLDSKLDNSIQLLVDIRSISTKALVQIKKTERVMLRGIFEKSDVPSCIVLLSERINSADRDVSMASNWLSKLSMVWDRIHERVDNMSTCVDSLVNHSTRKFYLYLVDEYTMQPVVPEERIETRKGGSKPLYPLEINTQSPMIKFLLPLMKVQITIS